MLSQQTVTKPETSTTEQLLQVMGKKLHMMAGRDIRNKLRTGEIALVDGRFTGECLQVKRPPRR